MIEKSKAETAVILARQAIGSPYVYGAWGGECTPAYRRQYAGYNPAYREKIVGRCPVLSGKTDSCQGCPYQGKGAYDCRGFVRWVFWQIGIEITGGGATTQYETKANWDQRGPIENMPEAVCAVYRHESGKMAHTGVYVGGGRVIHCSGEVKESPLDASWTHYAVPKGLYTPSEWTALNENRPRRALRRGDSGEDVKDMQEILLSLGYDLGDPGADGVFGRKTESAVKAFQSSRGIRADGTVGDKTWAALDAVRDKQPAFTVIIPHLSRAAAEALFRSYPGSTYKEEESA